MQGYKATLPEGLREAMKLDLEQFEELEVGTLEQSMQFAAMAAEFDLEGPQEVEVAFRPSRNPGQQFFAIRYSMMLDNGCVRCEVASFKPMGRKEYLAYCQEEFGSVPQDLAEPSLN